MAVSTLDRNRASGLGSNAIGSARALLLGAILLLAACDETSAPRAASSSALPDAPTSTKGPEHDPCEEYPPPFEASYLPDGFEKKLRRGAGLFKGTDYPTRGLVGHYLGETNGIHVNFQIRNGALPYEPANPHRVRDVLGRSGEIGKIEDGWAVEFSLDDCYFRMDTYGIDRAETVKVARGLREAD